MNILLRILNTVLLAGILVLSVLVFLQLRSIGLQIQQPLAVKEPIAVQGWGTIKSPLGDAYPILVTIDEQPVQVEIAR